MSNPVDHRDCTLGEVSLRALRWMELRQNGQPSSAEEICSDRPDLLPAVAQRIRILQLGEAALGIEVETLSSDESRSAARTTEGPLAGEVGLPGYEILGELGRGAMGVVYKARQIALNRLVAIKMILNAQQAGREGRARFRLEAEAVARLQHPNIVQIYEIGEHDGT